MQETIRLVPKQAELTRSSTFPRLEGRGNIFMSQEVAVDPAVEKTEEAKEESRRLQEKLKKEFAKDKQKRHQPVTEGPARMGETTAVDEKAVEQIHNKELQGFTQDLFKAAKLGTMTEAQLYAATMQYMAIGDKALSSVSYEMREQFLEDAAISLSIIQQELQKYYTNNHVPLEQRLNPTEDRVNVPQALEREFGGEMVHVGNNVELYKYTKRFMQLSASTPLSSWDSDTVLSNFARLEKLKTRIIERGFSNASAEKELVTKLSNLLTEELEKRVAKKEITEKEVEAAKKPEQEEVLKTAAIEDDRARISKAQEVLAKLAGVEKDALELTEEQQEAILKAHYIGQGEVGKDSQQAGVYNYTKEQLRQKAEILEKAGFSPAERRAIIEAGVAAINPALFDPGDPAYSGIGTDTYARDAARGLRDNAANLNGEMLSDIMSRITRERIDRVVKGQDSAAIAELSERLSGEIRNLGGDDEQIKRHLQLYLQENELDLMSQDGGEGAIEWLNGQFDKIYTGAQSGQELDSPVLQELERKVGYAISFLDYKFSDRPEVWERFFNQYTYRQKLMVMRVVIGQKNVESLAGAASQLRMHGFLECFGFEDQNVRRVFLRMNDKLEDMRLNNKEGGIEKAVTAEMVARMQKQVEAEELRIFTQLYQNTDPLVREKSSYWAMIKDAKIDAKKGDTDVQKKADELEAAGEPRAQAEVLAKAQAQRDAHIREAKNAIRRTVRMSYDLLITSQREALIVARGRQPLDQTKGYRSVPSSLFSFFNPETMMWGGWEMRNPEANAFFDKIKIDMAEDALQERGFSAKSLNDLDKIEYGARLHRDLSPIGDVFSGSWRRQEMLAQLEKIIRFKVASKDIVASWKARYGELTRAQVNALLSEKKVYIKSLGRTIDPTTELRADIDAIKARYNNGKLRDDTDKQQAKASFDQMGLFIKLRDVGDAGDFRTDKKPEAHGDGHGHGHQESPHEKGRKVWSKIAQTKPEEIIRILKDRIPLEKQGMGYYDELRPLQIKIQQAMHIDNDTISAYLVHGNGASPFDLFREKYGGVVTMLRERAVRGEGNDGVPYAVNIANLQTPEQELVNQVMGAEGNASNLMKIYQEMQEYIKDHKVEDALSHKKVDVIQLLMQDYRFEDMYNRVYSLDDQLMDEVEELPGIAVECGELIPVSSKLSPTPGDDSYRRAVGNDGGDGIKATLGLYKFLKNEKQEAKLEGAMEYIDALTSANGQGDGAKALRYTYGSYLTLLRPHYWLDVIGLKKLPWRIPASEIEKIYGPEAHPMERAQIRQIIDSDLRSLLEKSDMNEAHQDRIAYERKEISAEEVKQRAHHRHHDNEEMLHSLKAKANVLPWAGFNLKPDEVKTNALQGIMMLIMFLVGESINIGKESISGVAPELAAGGGGGGGGGHH